MSKTFFLFFSNPLPLREGKSVETRSGKAASLEGLID